MRYFTLTLISTLTIFAAGCAADAGKEEQETQGIDELKIDTEGMQSGCFYTREVNNWEAVNRTQLIVYAPNDRRAFLVTVAPPSSSLRFASELGFGGRDRICGRTGERIFVPSGIDRSYAILDVRRLDEAALTSYRENLRASKDTRVEPRESPGAEVEEDIGGAGEPGAEPAEPEADDGE